MVPYLWSEAFIPISKQFSSNTEDITALCRSIYLSLSLPSERSELVEILYLSDCASFCRTSVSVCVCSKPVKQTVGALNANSSKTVKAMDFKCDTFSGSFQTISIKFMEKGHRGCHTISKMFGH